MDVHILASIFVQQRKYVYVENITNLYQTSTTGNLLDQSKVLLHEHGTMGLNTTSTILPS